jgi:hypothetical protein
MDNMERNNLDFKGRRTLSIIKNGFTGIWLLFLVGCGGGESSNSVPLLSFDIPSEVAEGSPVTLVSTSIDPDGYVHFPYPETDIIRVF